MFMHITITHVGKSTWELCVAIPFLMQYVVQQLMVNTSCIY